MVIKVVAHRGNCDSAYENTLESILAAIESGITHVEIDIQFTQDQVPIVFHDDNWLRMTGELGKVAETSSEVLDKLVINQKAALKNSLADPKSSEVSKLADVIDLLSAHPKVTLFVEVKTEIFTHCSYQKCYQVLEHLLRPVKSQVVLISFSYRFLRLCALKNQYSLGYVLPSWQSYSDKMLRRLSPDYIYCDIEIFPDDFKVEGDKPNWALYEFTQAHKPQKYFAQGVKYLETYFPVALQAKLLSLGLLA